MAVLLSRSRREEMEARTGKVAPQLESRSPRPPTGDSKAGALNRYPELPPSKPSFTCLLWSPRRAGAGLGCLQMLLLILGPPRMGPIHQVLAGLVLAPCAVPSPQGQLRQWERGSVLCSRGWVSGVYDSPAFFFHFSNLSSLSFNSNIYMWTVCNLPVTLTK